MHLGHLPQEASGMHPMSVSTSILQVYAVIITFGKENNKSNCVCMCMRACVCVRLRARARVRVCIRVSVSMWLCICVPILVYVSECLPKVVTLLLQLRSLQLAWRYPRLPGSWSPVTG